MRNYISNLKDKQMKQFTIKFMTYAALVAGIFLLNGCKEKEPKLSVSPTQLTFRADDTQEQSVTIETNASNWDYKVSYQSESGWMNVYTKANNDNQLFVKVSDYTDTNASRTGKITINAGKATAVDVTVEQIKKPINTLSVNPTSLTFEANEVGNRTVAVTTDAPSWDANTSASWIQLNKQGQQLTVNVSSQNTQSNDRTADVVFKAGNAPDVTLKVTQKYRETLTVEPPSLTFSATGSKQTLTITTNAPNWNASTAATWITLEVNSNILSVTASPNTSSSARNATISVTAGSATPVTVNVTQNGTSSQPINVKYNYKATGNPVLSITGLNATTWNGVITPANTAIPPWIEIDNWGNVKDLPIYLDYKNGNYWLDMTTEFNSNDGIHVGALRWATFNSSTSTFTIYSTDYQVTYNEATRVLDFSGTYQGSPIIIGYFLRNKNTNQYNANLWFSNVYTNLKIELTSTAPAPQIQSSQMEGMLKISNASNTLFEPKKISDNIKIILK